MAERALRQGESVLKNLTKILTLRDLKLAAHKIGATIERNRDGVEILPPANHEWCGGEHSYVVLLVDWSDGKTPLDKIGKSEAYRDAIDRISYGYAPCEPDCEVNGQTCGDGPGVVL